MQPTMMSGQQSQLRMTGAASATMTFLGCSSRHTQDTRNHRLGYVGFTPEYFEAPIYERLGSSVAIGEENDDVKELLNFLDDSPRGRISSHFVI
jgi:hypothetical protein